MLSLVKNFGADEDGAITADWTVLTSAIVGVGILVIATVQGGASELAEEVSGALTDGEVLSIADPSAG